MGLNITTVSDSGEKVVDYERLGSYMTLHILREWIFELVGNTKEAIKAFYSYENQKKDEVELKVGDYPCLLDHSDCQGGYISFKAFGIVSVKNRMEWADLDCLRKELKSLKKIEMKMPEEVAKVFQLFYKIVNKKDIDGHLPTIVLFR